MSSVHMISIGTKKLTTSDFESVLFQDAHVQVDVQALERVRKNFEFLIAYSKDKIIYGINTGLGPMAQYKISDSDQKELQYNLIRSHCAGAGDLFPEELSRATMLARLNGLALGFSGIQPSLLNLIADLLNKKISACIFQHGGVGASGDLVQLAYLALNLIGEGEVFYQGKLQPASGVFATEQITPLTIQLREGLALVNGTSAMTGVGIVNVIQAKKALNFAVILSSVTNELMKSFDDHFSVELNRVKHHTGQQKIAEAMRMFLADSKLIRKRPDHLYNHKIEEAVFTDKVQEYYSLRCVPQVLGPIYDTIVGAEQVVENELNSVNDNPVIDHERENVYHGGNFHGDYVALEMDKLKIAMTKLCMLSERQINYLLNDKLNHKLPPFINLGKLGLNFGMQGLQFVATSSTAENQTLSYPMYLHSISNNNDNQDIVSMGCNAAFLTRQVISNTLDVLAVQTIALMQGVDYLKCHGRLASSTHRLYDVIRAIVPAFEDDSPKHKSIHEVREYILKSTTEVLF
jgi:histidine ammonia-lyase